MVQIEREAPGDCSKDAFCYFYTIRQSYSLYKRGRFKEKLTFSVNYKACTLRPLYVNYVID